MVFWQTMSGAELAFPVWTLERQECFLATHFTFHVGEALFSLLKANDRLYVSQVRGRNERD